MPLSENEDTVSCSDGEQSHRARSSQSTQAAAGSDQGGYGKSTKCSLTPTAKFVQGPRQSSRSASKRCTNVHAPRENVRKYHRARQGKVGDIHLLTHV